MKNKFQSQLLLSGVPKDIKLAFKSACAKKGVTMKKAILQFMEDFTRRCV